MTHICLKCGNVTEVLAEGGRCPMCGTVIATRPFEARRGASKSRERRKTEVRDADLPKRGESADSGNAMLSESSGNLCVGLFGAAIVTYPLGIFLPMATISKHMDAKDALDTADGTGTGRSFYRHPKKSFGFSRRKSYHRR